MIWLMWALAIYGGIAVIVAAVVLWTLWDYNPAVAGLAALKMGLGWPWWLLKFIF